MSIIQPKGTKKKTISVILLAAGAKYGIKTLGPVSLIDLNENTKLIDQQLSILYRDLNPKEIILVGGFDAHKVYTYLPRDIIFVENSEFQSSGITRSLSLGIKASTNDKILVIHGDLLFNNLAELNLHNKSQILIDQTNSIRNHEIGCNIIKRKVEIFWYDISTKWAKIIYFSGNELKILNQFVHKKENSNLLDFELYNKVIKNGGNFMATLPKDLKVVDIDRTQDARNN